MNFSLSPGRGPGRGSMPKPVTPQEMFDLWQKMVNPGA